MLFYIMTALCRKWPTEADQWLDFKRLASQIHLVYESYGDISFDLGGGGELVVRLVVLEAGLEIALPITVGGEGVARGLTAAGVELDKLCLLYTSPSPRD